ncbi:MAG TPA: hypothetical protein VHB25_07375 [Gemmatimonadaceae bacterium]|nr:hypothetical protein [Gemmatimonadaceae bacterium]
MPAISRRSLGLAIAIPIFVVACRRDRHSQVGIRDASFVARDTARPLGPGDIRIANTDSSFELALIGDSLVTGLGERVLREINDKTDTSKVEGNGFAAGIEKFVKGTVANALSHELRFPLSEISDVKYENDRLVFYGNDGKPMKLFDNTEVDHKKANETFAPADAQRFVAAFQAKKKRTG